MQQYSLSIPGIRETKTTLAQSTPLRLVPWFILLEGVISLFTSNLMKVVSSFISYPVSWLKPATIFLYSIISLAIAYFLASRIRYGDMVFVWFVRITAIISIVGSLVQSDFFITGFQSSFLEINYYTLSFYAQQIINVLINTYLLYVLFKYEKELQGGESFKKEPNYSEEKEKLVHRAGITIIIVIPLLYSIGFYLWSLQQITQKFMQEDNVPSYQYLE